MADSVHLFLEKFPLARQSVALAEFTTLKIGGPADLYYELTNIAEAEDLFQQAKALNIPFFVLGGGSNTLFHDAGFRGLVIHLKARNIEVIVDSPSETAVIVADAGALLSQVLQAATKNHLTGMENLMGLPGTVGGAVRGNAGAFGTETKDILQKVLLYDPENGVHEVPAGQLELSYRSSAIKKAKGSITVLRAWFQLSTTPQPNQATSHVSALAQRLKKQPAGKTSGSFFKNPTHGAQHSTPGTKPLSTPHTAGYLLDQAGCKGLQCGDAQISTQHANWIMNTGNATQKDVLELVKMAQKRVQDKFGILLEPEVQLVGEHGMLGE